MLVYKANPILRSNMKIVRVQKKYSKNSEKSLEPPQILRGGWSKDEKKKYKFFFIFLGLRDLSSYILRKK